MSIASCICCLRCRVGSPFGTGHVPLESLPTVKLDTSCIGNDVVIVKSGKRVCGSGAALANAPIVQDKAYFEVKLQSSGIWGVGLASKKVDLNQLPLGSNADSWVLRHDGIFAHNNTEIAKLADIPQEGDIIGLSYDHIELNFFVNGQALDTPITGIRGTVYPVFYVDEGAIMDVQFSTFYHSPPPGFEEIMIEKSLL